MTERPAFSQPYGDVNTLLSLADRYDIRYFAFEPRGRLELLRDLYDNAGNYDQLIYLGEVNEIRIFQFP